MARAVPIAIIIVSALVVLGLPFLDGKFGFPDDRVLPASASAHQVGNEMRRNFNNNSSTNLSVIAEGVGSVPPREIDEHAADLSNIEDVKEVAAPTGAFIRGMKVGPPASATGIKNDTALFTVQTAAKPYTEAAERQLDAIHALPGPADVLVKIGGEPSWIVTPSTALCTSCPWCWPSSPSSPLCCYFC